jgi:hypothetical protein
LYYNYYYRVNQWDSIVLLLRQSLFAEEMVCAVSSELFHIPETKNLEGNAEMHSNLVPASYHRITATGSAQRLKNGEQRQSVIDTMAACIVNAEIEDRGVRAGLGVMLEHASPEYKPVVQMIIRWQDQAEATLKQARDALQSMGISLPLAGEEAPGSENGY